MPDPAVAAGRVREVAGEVRMLARLTRHLPRWLRMPITLKAAGERVRRGLAAREERFLRLADTAIYGYPRSPYRQLLRHVGCEAGDLRRLVHVEGLEGALKILAAQGVYVTFDELKGRRETVRGGARFSFTEDQFDSPLLAPHWVVFTGGSRGKPGRVLRSLTLVEEIAGNAGATLAAHGLAGARHVFWLTNPIAQMLVYAKLGEQTVGWLQPLDHLPIRARLGAGYFAGAARLLGRRLPMPRRLDFDDAHRLAAWIDRRPRDGRPFVLNTMPSSAVRVAVAAQAAGIDLTGVTFHVQSEPMTEARRNHLTATGAGVLVNYGSIETPTFAYGCAASSEADDLHVFEDRFALIERDRLVNAAGPNVNAMLITTLTERAGKICLNAEPGDYGRIERRACGCSLGTLGLTLHLSEVRSFEKLSGEGVSFARSSLLQVLEETLPSRFGGSAVDYQLVEEEGADSATRVILRVSPAVGPIDEEAVRTTLLTEFGRGGVVDQSHATLLRLAGSVQISRQPPIATGVGKVLPFHLLRAPKGPS